MDCLLSSLCIVWSICEKQPAIFCVGVTLLMKKVCVFTSTRAEYGLLFRLIKEIEESDELELQLVVTGTHLSHEYGYTVNNILKDGFKPALQVPILISDDSAVSLIRSSALLSLSLGEFFERESPDYFVVLGDRIELLPACEAALISKVPIVHIHGGEITEGAVDEKVRHAVSKMADIHFTSTEEYRRRVIQMGESPETVVNCGALGLEGLEKDELLSREELSDVVEKDLSSGYFLIVYHPETNKKEENIEELIRALSVYERHKKVIIYPNSDMMSRDVIAQIETYAELKPEEVVLIKSAKRDVYLSLMARCDIFVGNSSSGIIEAPSLGCSIVNIGDRQKGRIRSESTIDVELGFEEIKGAFELALSQSFREKLPSIKNPYEGDKPSKAIVSRLCDKQSLELNKRFFDLEFDI